MHSYHKSIPSLNFLAVEEWSQSEYWRQNHHSHSYMPPALIAYQMIVVLNNSDADFLR